MKTRWIVIPILAMLALSLRFARAEDAIPSMRQPVPLTQLETDYLLNEMHHNLEALSMILGAISQNDANQAAQAAASRGLASYGDRDPNRPKSLTAALPAGWRPMAMQLRRSFDELAAGVSAHESTAQSLGRVSAIMSLCNGCHATYRFVAKT